MKVNVLHRTFIQDLAALFSCPRRCYSIFDYDSEEELNQWLKSKRSSSCDKGSLLGPAKRLLNKLNSSFMCPEYLEYSNVFIHYSKIVLILTGRF